MGASSSFAFPAWTEGLERGPAALLTERSGWFATLVGVLSSVPEQREARDWREFRTVHELSNRRPIVGRHLLPPSLTFDARAWQFDCEPLRWAGHEIDPGVDLVGTLISRRVGDPMTTNFRAVPLLFYGFGGPLAHNGATLTVHALSPEQRRTGARHAERLRGFLEAQGFDRAAG